MISKYPQTSPILVSLVIPLFNEQENLPELYARLSDSLSKLPVDYELVLVNDGSRDATPHMLHDLADRDSHVVAVHLSRNFGHQAAVSAGLDQAKGDAVIVMDGDLQDPPEVLGDFLQRWREGFEVVYAVRQKRKEPLWKRAGYFLFYRMLKAMSDLDIPLDSGDFCLMDRKVLDALKNLPERLRFVRGLRTFVGFRQTGLAYERAARNAGTPKYTLKALIKLAKEGLLSFSSVPLESITLLGFLGLAATAVFALGRLAFGSFQESTLHFLGLWFLGSVQLVSLGIVGEYIRRIFLEVKGRPTYIIREVERSHRPGNINPAESTPRQVA